MPAFQFPSFRRLVLIPAGTLLVVGPAVLAFSHRAATAKAPELPPPLVQTAKPALADVPVTSSLSGTLAPFAHAKLYAKVAGYLKAIYVDKGDRVKAGQLLAVIDAPELQAQVSSAKSKVLQARADLLERQAAFQKAESERHITALGFDRLHGARKQTPELIAPMEEDLAKAKAEQAVMGVETARSQVAAARAALASQLAQQRQLEDQLAYTRIVAPFAGIIAARYVDPGALVQTGVSSSSQARSVVELIDADRLRLDVHVAETDVPYVKVGTPVTVSLPAVPGAERRTLIKRTSVSEATDTRTMLAEAELANHDQAWHPGMFAKVTLQLQVHANALTLPAEAVRREGERASVFVVGADGKLHVKAIELGAVDGVRAEIKGGLAATDTVALQGTEPLRDGMEVRHG